MDFDNPIFWIKYKLNKNHFFSCYFQINIAPIWLFIQRVSTDIRNVSKKIWVVSTRLTAQIYNAWHFSGWTLCKQREFVNTIDCPYCHFKHKRFNEINEIQGIVSNIAKQIVSCCSFHFKQFCGFFLCFEKSIVVEEWI